MILENLAEDCEPDENAAKNQQTGLCVVITPDMIEVCRDVLVEWGAFEWGRPLPDDSLMSWALEAAFRAAGFSPQNPLGPELDD